MNQSSDKRTQPRIKFSNTPVSLYTSKIFSNIFSGNEKSELVDLSKSGAGIISSKPLKKGETIKIKVKLPEEKNLDLKGTIRWVNPLNSNKLFRIGMQFNPFGNKRNYNSLEYLERLNILTA